MISLFKETLMLSAIHNWVLLDTYSEASLPGKAIPSHSYEMSVHQSSLTSDDFVFDWKKKVRYTACICLLTFTPVIGPPPLSPWVRASVWGQPFHLSIKPILSHLLKDNTSNFLSFLLQHQFFSLCSAFPDDIQTHFGFPIKKPLSLMPQQSLSPFLSFPKRRFVSMISHSLLKSSTVVFILTTLPFMVTNATHRSKIQGSCQSLIIGILQGWWLSACFDSSLSMASWITHLLDF